jgi:hypothetical protein
MQPQNGFRQFRSTSLLLGDHVLVCMYICMYACVILLLVCVLCVWMHSCVYCVYGVCAYVFEMRGSVSCSECGVCMCVRVHEYVYVRDACIRYLYVR